jgi:protein phosphatase
VADLGTPDAVRESHRDDRPIGERGYLYLVADGMGGAAAGEIASEMAATIIHRHMVEAWSSDPTISEERFTGHLRQALERANSEIHHYALAHPDLHGMGTTATVAGARGDRLFLAQIGDSRAYLIRNGEAQQLTRDQSLTQRLVEVGELTEEEAEASERRNIILQALGPDSLVRVDLSWQLLQQGDLLLLCSDGLSTVVRRDNIARIARESPDVVQLSERLIAMANEGGGPDNITVVVVRFEGDGLPLVAGESAGYHHLPGEDERPALHPTLAFPAVSRSQVVVTEAPRRGSPTTLALAILATTMLLLGVALYWLR